MNAVYNAFPTYSETNAYHKHGNVQYIWSKTSLHNFQYEEDGRPLRQ
jgi:hypothetical protein